jgi:drug/metabolite transporter (DMT)-like permease
VLLNEKLTRTVIIGLGLALFGGTVIGLSDACVLQNGLKCPQLSQVLQAAQGSAMWGNFLALAGAWAITGYLIIGRKLRAKMSLIPYIFLVYGIAAVVLVVLMFTAGQSPTGYPLKSYGWIFLLAAIPQLVGHSMFNWLLKYLSATMVAVTTLSEPIGSAVLAFIFLKESPASAVMLGGAFILIGIYLTSKQRN